MSAKEECNFCEEEGEEGSFFYCNTYDYHVCDHCVREYYMDCECCGDTTQNDHGRFMDKDMNVFYCDVCADEEEEEEVIDSKRCITCGYKEPIYKFADFINGEVVMTDECKGCYVEQKEYKAEPIHKKCIWCPDIIKDTTTYLTREKKWSNSWCCESCHRNWYNFGEQKPY